MSGHRSNQQRADARPIVLPRTADVAVQRWTIPIQYMQGAICLVDVVLIVGASLAFRQFIALTGLPAPMLRLDHIGILSATLFAVFAQLVGAYELPTHLTAGRSVMRAVHAWVGVILFSMALGIALLDLVRIVPWAIAIWFLTCGLALAAGRISMVGLMRVMRRQGVFDQRSAVIGTGRQAAALSRYIADHQILTLSLVGFYGDRPARDLSDGSDQSLPYLGDFDALLRSIRKGMVNRVIIALAPDEEDRVRDMVALLSQTPVEVRLVPVSDGFWTQHRVEVLGEMPVVTLQDWPLSRSQCLLKAIEDSMIALVALIAVMPVMVIVAVAIKLDSPGPILFRQQRQGFNCRNFPILKFRTMHAGLGPVDAVVQAQRNDARVTRVGAILRRTSLDELPQLINVLRGDMSLVGPRPHAPTTRAAGRLFGDIAQAYPTRHNVKPGMTGWAQVCGWRGETSSEEQLLGRLEHDLYYVRHWSIWFDLRIMARTIAIVLRQNNAY